MIVFGFLGGCSVVWYHIALPEIEWIYKQAMTRVQIPAPAIYL